MNIRSIGEFAIGPVGAALVALISVPLMARYFSAESIGQMAMLQIAASLAVLVLSLGLDQSYVREYQAEKDRRLLFKTALTPGLAVLAAIMILVMAAGDALSVLLFGVRGGEYNLLAAIFILGSFVTRFQTLMLRMREKGLLFSLSQILPKLLLLLFIVAYALLSVPFSLDSLLAAQTIAVLAALLVCVWHSWPEWRLAFSASIDLRQLACMLRYGMPLVASSLAYWVMTAADKALLRQLSTFTELGLYSIAASVAGVASVFTGIFNTLWAPALYRSLQGDDTQALVLDATEHVLAAATAILSMTGLFSWLVAWILPEQYRDIQFFIAACMQAPLFYSLSETSKAGIGIQRRSSLAMLASILAAGINVMLTMALIPPYGAAGAAAALAIAFWVFLVVRTELACLVWRSIPRLKFYVVTGLLTALVVSSALVGKHHPEFFQAVWALETVVAFWLFRRSLTAARRFFRQLTMRDLMNESARL